MKTGGDAAARLAGLLLACALLCPAPGAAQIQGVITEILDGDTVTVDAEGRTFKLDLAGIDAPELKEPLSAEARSSLGELCYGRTATIEDIEIDPKRRVVGHIECDGTDATAEQVRRGFARVMENDPANDLSLRALQEEARLAGRGIWAETP